MQWTRTAKCSRLQLRVLSMSFLRREALLPCLCEVDSKFKRFQFLETWSLWSERVWFEQARLKWAKITVTENKIPRLIHARVRPNEAKFLRRWIRQDLQSQSFNFDGNRFHQSYGGRCSVRVINYCRAGTVFRCKASGNAYCWPPSP